jgi:hypothetical protein
VSEAGGPRPLRLSDFDREQAISDLKAHAAAGRLSVDELAERVAAAYGASTFGELADLMGDLPAVEDSKPVVRATATQERHVPFWPGVRAFSEVVEVPRPPSEVRRRVLEHLAPALAKSGYELVEAGDEQLTFQFDGRTGSFSLPRRLTIRMTFEPLREGRTRLLAHGKAPLGVRRGFASLAQL